MGGGGSAEEEDKLTAKEKLTPKRRGDISGEEEDKLPTKEKLTPKRRRAQEEVDEGQEVAGARHPQVPNLHHTPSTPNLTP